MWELALEPTQTGDHGVYFLMAAVVRPQSEVRHYVAL